MREQRMCASIGRMPPASPQCPQTGEARTGWRDTVGIMPAFGPHDSIPVVPFCHRDFFGFLRWLVRGQPRRASKTGVRHARLRR
jgi:hypothetical protein